MSAHDLTVRDLLMHLPELLAGAHPVAAEPRVLQWLAEDPEARAAVHAVSRLAGAMEGWTGRLPEPRAFEGRVLQSVAKSHEQFRVALGELLLGSGLAHLKAATASSDFFTGLTACAATALTSSQVQAAAARVLEILRRRGGEDSEARAILALRSSGSREVDQVEWASTQLETARRLMPGHHAVTYYAIEARSMVSPVTALRDWRRFVRECRTPTAAGFALEGTAGCLFARGEYSAAHHVLLEAEARLPFSAMIPFNGLLAGLLAGEERTWGPTLQRFCRRFQDTPVNRQGYATTVSANARAWRQAQVRNEPGMGALLGELPPAIRVAIERCLT